MVMTCGGAGGSRSGSGSSSGTEHIYEGLREFIASDIMHGILDVSFVMFGTIKEGIVEMIEECFRAYGVEIFVGHYGAHTLSFKDIRGCRA